MQLQTVLCYSYIYNMIFITYILESNLNCIFRECQPSSGPNVNSGWAPVRLTAFMHSAFKINKPLYAVISTLFIVIELGLSNVGP
jgi:hypothetical protein